MFRFSIYLFVCNCIYLFACFFVCLKLHISLLFIETHSMFCIHLLVCLQLYMISPILCCVDVLLFCFLFIYLSVLFHSFFEELKPNPPLVIHFLGQNQHWSVCSLADFELSSRREFQCWLISMAGISRSFDLNTHTLSEFHAAVMMATVGKVLCRSTLFLLPPAVEWPRPQWLLSNRFQWWMSGFVLLVCAAWRYCSRWQ